MKTLFLFLLKKQTGFTLTGGLPILLFLLAGGGLYFYYKVVRRAPGPASENAIRRAKR
jgi:hypothetical protein